MADTTGLQPVTYSNTVIRERTQACAQSFRKCLSLPQLSDSDEIWIEQKGSEFNWWSSGLNADKRGPGSLDSRLTLRPDVRDVIVEVLEGLADALQKHQVLILEAPVQEESIEPDIYHNEEDDLNHDDDEEEDDDEDDDEDKENQGEEAKDNQLQDNDGENVGGPSMPVNTQRVPSPWSDMASSGSGSTHSGTLGAASNEDQDPNDNLHQKALHEQKVYINTNLQVLIRIHTAIKRSGLKFRNKRADDALRESEEAYRQVRDQEGESVALSQPCGEHEVFRRYLTQLVLANGYTYNLLQRLGNCCSNTASDQYLQRPCGVVLVVIRAYLRDPSRLTTVQQRLIDANIMRRSRLIYAGNSSREQMRPKPQPVEQLQQGAMHPINPTIPESFVLDRDPILVPPISALTASQPAVSAIKAANDDELKPVPSYIAQPATELGSIFSITGALMPARTNRSAATKMSARVGNLDYPKCPVEHGHFPCPYCPTFLSEEYTKKEKWRAHVAQDLCAYVCVFEDCDSPDEIFSTTYEWMSHMARYHAEVEWFCPLCAKDGQYQDPATYAYGSPEDLEAHLTDSHDADGNDLDLLLESARQTIGIQQVACPLCRPGLVTLESAMDDDELVEEHGTGLIQLEEDEHIATHIHEFALQAFPHRGALSSTDSTSLNSESSFDSRVEITFASFGGHTSENQQLSPYSWEEVHDMVVVVVEHIGDPQPLEAPQAIQSLRGRLVKLLIGLFRSGVHNSNDGDFDEKQGRYNQHSTGTADLLNLMTEVASSAAFLALQMNRFIDGHRLPRLFDKLHNSIIDFHAAFRVTQDAIERLPRYTNAELGTVLKSCQNALLLAEQQLPGDESMEPEEAIQYLEKHTNDTELQEIVTRIESGTDLLHLFFRTIVGSEMSQSQASSIERQLKRAALGYHGQLPGSDVINHSLPVEVIASRLNKLRLIAADYQRALEKSGPEQEREIKDATTETAIYEEEDRIQFETPGNNPVMDQTELSTNLENKREVPSDADAGASIEPAEASSSVVYDAMIAAVPSPFSRLAGHVVPLSDTSRSEALITVGALYKSAATVGEQLETQLEWAEKALRHIRVLTEAQALFAQATSKEEVAEPNSSTRLQELRIQAMEIVDDLARKEHQRAIYIQSMWIDFGWFGFQPDKVKARAGYQRAADKGFLRAYYRIGRLLENTESAGPQEHLEADHYFATGRELGDAACYYRLGMMYLFGEHYKDRDIARGAYLLRTSAEGADEDSPQGAYAYGMLLLDELPNVTLSGQDGVASYGPQPERAWTYIEKAALLGYAKAQFKMSQGYEMGQQGSGPDLALSIHWLRLAATRREPEAVERLARWYIHGCENVLDKNERIAFAYTLYAARRGLVIDQFLVGSFYEDGFGVAVNRQEADWWYRKAALNGHQPAIDKLDGLPEVPSAEAQGDLPHTRETDVNFTVQFPEYVTRGNVYSSASGGESRNDLIHYPLDTLLSLGVYWTLFITIKRASRIPRRVFFGRQHPYCTISFGQEKHRTRTHRGGSRDPQWEETFNFEINNNTYLNNPLSLIIRHDGPRDDLIASASIVIPFDGPSTSLAREVWYELGYQGKPAGKILVDFL